MGHKKRQTSKCVKCSIGYQNSVDQTTIFFQLKTYKKVVLFVYTSLESAFSTDDILTYSRKSTSVNNTVYVG